MVLYGKIMGIFVRLPGLVIGVAPATIVISNINHGFWSYKPTFMGKSWEYMGYPLVIQQFVMENPLFLWAMASMAM